MHPHYYGDYGMGSGSGFFDFLGHLILIVFVIWIVLMIVRRSRGGTGRWHSYGMWQSHSALNILNERFAKGEIDQKDYEERKKVLLGEMK
jgi:putative membrane protein